MLTQKKKKKPLYSCIAMSECSLLRSHGVEGGHNVVGGLEELENAVLELFLLVSTELIAGVVLLQGLFSADGQHLGHKGDVGFSGGSLHL